MKEMWYGFDKKGLVIDNFFGTYGDAVDYFNSDKCSPLVERFDRKNSVDNTEDFHVSLDARICGIVFEHGDNDFGFWEGFNLSEEDENAIYSILIKYDTQGCSVRGTRKQIIEEME